MSFHWLTTNIPRSKGEGLGLRDPEYQKHKVVKYWAASCEPHPSQSLLISSCTSLLTNHHKIRNMWNVTHSHIPPPKVYAHTHSKGWWCQWFMKKYCLLSSLKNKDRSTIGSGDIILGSTSKECAQDMIESLAHPWIWQ
jgi:hypothetical protein